MPAVKKVSGTEKEVATEIITRESHDGRNVTTVKNSNEAVKVGTRRQKFEYGRICPKVDFLHKFTQGKSAAPTCTAS